MKCIMCIATKRGPAKLDVDGGGVYLKLEDGSGIGMNEADLYVRGFREGLKRAAAIFELRARETEGRSPARMILDRVHADIEKALAESV